MLRVEAMRGCVVLVLKSEPVRSAVVVRPDCVFKERNGKVLSGEVIAQEENFSCRRNNV